MEPIEEQITTLLGLTGCSNVLEVIEHVKKLQGQERQKITDEYLYEKGFGVFGLDHFYNENGVNIRKSTTKTGKNIYHFGHNIIRFVDEIPSHNYD